jgi:hypothetical protein
MKSKFTSRSSVDSRQKAKKLFDIAFEFIQNQQLEDAKTIFGKLIAITPLDLETYLSSKIKYWMR